MKWLGSKINNKNSRKHLLIILVQVLRPVRAAQVHLTAAVVMRMLLGTWMLERERKSSQMRKYKKESRASLKVSLINRVAHR